MIKTIVAGASGRMGGRIIQMISQSQDVTLSAAFEHPEHPSVNEDVGQFLGLGKMGVKIEAPGVMVIEAVQEGDDLHIDPADFGDTDEASQIKSDYETWVGKL